jgi:pantoate--beta-alanine ligase
MKVIKEPALLQKIALKHFKDDYKIGLVPTMGALHEGHISLFEKSKTNDDITIVSIFVNPTQFGHNEDYLKYPRPLQKDLLICKKAHIDYVFTPSVDSLFAKNYKTFIEVKELQDILCGKSRPGHFRGVAAVVTKLFNLSYADNAYFGLKDFQQVKVIEKMTKDLNFKTKIISCPIIREKDGLAISSRNSYLNMEEKKTSLNIFRILKEAAENFKNKKMSIDRILKSSTAKFKEIKKIKIDYVEILDVETLKPFSSNSKKHILAVAVKVGKTRLIDNIFL